jgi:hypothetical protein
VTSIVIHDCAVSVGSGAPKSEVRSGQTERRAASVAAIDDIGNANVSTCFVGVFQLART